MSVKDFMTRKVVYISPDTTIAHAADIMREQDLHRLPVIENDKLVGLVTEGTIAEASPSKATSLSIYEMNYLLNKTKVKDVMIKNVITVSGYASLEDAAYLMYKTKWGFFQLLTTANYMGSLLIVIFLQLFFMSQVMEKKEYALGSLLKIRQGS